MLIHGKCHCGNIRFTLDWPGDGGDIVVRNCGCSFCVKHGGSWTSNRAASLDARIADPALLSRYRFGTATADFYTCSRCGVVPFVVSNIDAADYAVVSVNAFEGIDASRLPRAPISFDGEGTGERLERRKRNWIPKVRIATGA